MPSKENKEFRKEHPAMDIWFAIGCFYWAFTLLLSLFNISWPKSYVGRCIMVILAVADLIYLIYFDVRMLKFKREQREKHR